MTAKSTPPKSSDAKLLKTNKNGILEDFKSKKELLKKFSFKLEGLIGELLIDKSVSVHQISARVKEYDSLSKKIDRKSTGYDSLNGITDLVGLRIIVYLENEVDHVAEIIDKEFIVDKPNTVDKRNLKVDTFGYKSLHYVVSLNDERCMLTEYKRFKGLKTEIQIRSVLQHAWAEIEHDLGYKGANEIPEQQKRAFHRLAALLETADLEFVRLKKELQQYEQKVKKEIESRPEEVLIDKASLNSYLAGDLVKLIDHEISSTAIMPINIGNSAIDFILGKHSFFNIKTIKDLDDLLQSHKNQIVAYAKFNLSGSGVLPTGISIFYLFYVLLMKDPDIETIREYISYGGLNLDTAPEALLSKFKSFKADKK